MKNLLFICSALILAGAGCAKTSGGNTASLPINSTASIQVTANQPINSGYCPKVFTPADAEAKFGGAWRDSGVNTATSIKGEATGSCAYTLMSSVIGSDGITKLSTLTVAVNKAKYWQSLRKHQPQIVGLGDDAYTETLLGSTSLHVLKGELVVDISFGHHDSRGGSEDSSIDDKKTIAEVVLSRLP